MQGVALGDEQQPVKLGLLVPVQLQVDDRLLLQPRQFDMLGVFEDFRRRLAFGMAQDPVAVVQVAVQFHEPDGDQPVEPCVGHRLHRLLEAVLLDALFELLPLLGDGTGMLSAADHGHVAPFHDRLGLLGRQPVEGSTIRHRLDEIPASLRSIVLQLGAVHERIHLRQQSSQRACF